MEDLDLAEITRDVLVTRQEEAERHGFPHARPVKSRVAVEVADTGAGPRVAGLRLRTAGDGAPIPLVSYGYDERGRLVTITEPDSAPYLYEWDDHDRICGWVDRNGHEYDYEYDDEGRVVRAWGAGGYLNSALAYDSAQRATTVTDGLGHCAVYHYEAHQHVAPRA